MGKTTFSPTMLLLLGFGGVFGLLSGIVALSLALLTLGLLDFGGFGGGFLDGLDSIGDHNRRRTLALACHFLPEALGTKRRRRLYPKSGGQDYFTTRGTDGQVI